VLYLDPEAPQKHIPGVDFKKQYGRGEDNAEFEEEKDEMILNPNHDVVKKTQGKGGAIALDKQVGRPVDIDIDDDEHFLVADTPAVLNDPAKPRVRGGVVPFDKQRERFEYEPHVDDDPAAAEEIIMPAEVKPLPRAKFLGASMDKAQERFKYQEPKENVDLAEVLEDGKFAGTDCVDVLKAWKTNQAKEAVADFDHYQSIAKFRIDLPKEQYPKGDDGDADDD